ncbi:MAG: naiP [Chthoniobacteraceae bacterium]|nr:naiP [Chthoniobacteraceae bacterium]
MLISPPGNKAPPAAALTRGQWSVLIAALLGWLFDGYEIGLFPVVARPALQEILGAGGDGRIGFWMGVITACFLVGAALGGVLFGWLGDRIGRVRAMAFSILTYSLVTGFGYFADSGAQLGIVRGISALGMGGQWALGVALVMECWPERWRPLLAGIMGAAANFGFLLVGAIAKFFPVTPSSWRWMMLLAAIPALIVFFIIGFVPESERWRVARRENVNPLKEIFGNHLRNRTLVGVALASVALIGTWGSVQWLPLWADQLAGSGKSRRQGRDADVAGCGSHCRRVYRSIDRRSYWTAPFVFPALLTFAWALRGALSYRLNVWSRIPGLGVCRKWGNRLFLWMVPALFSRAISHACSRYCTGPLLQCRPDSGSSRRPNPGAACRPFWRELRAGRLRSHPDLPGRDARNLDGAGNRRPGAERLAAEAELEEVLV